MTAEKRRPILKADVAANRERQQSMEQLHLDAEPMASSTRSMSAFLEAFTSTMRQLPCVQRVLADYSHGVTLYTVYAGDLDDIADEMFEAHGRVMDQYPDLTVDFRFLSNERPSENMLPPTARILG